MDGKTTAPGFLCLCMSPAIDATVRLPRAPEGRGEIFKNVADEENAGGKALNVARWLALRGAAVSCGGLLGEDNASVFKGELARCGVGDLFVRVPCCTRRNEMITWPGGAVKLNRAAFPGLGNGDAAQVAEICEKVLTRLAQEAGTARKASDALPSPAVAILSGSLPPAVPNDFYAKAVARFKALGMTVVLDASGEAMRLALDARPDLVKPNAEECEALVGFVPKTPDGFRNATAALREKCAHAIISDGGAGAWFDGEFVAAPRVEVVDTTAAGDTLLAEYCWRTFGDQCENAAAWAVAAGSAACTMPGSLPPPAALVGALSLAGAKN